MAAIAASAIPKEMASRVPAGAALRLFGYKICPFCHTVKSVARAAGVPYAWTEVNPLSKAEIAFSKEHRKVPIALSRDGSIVGESSVIVDEILRIAPHADAAFAGDEVRRSARYHIVFA